MANLADNVIALQTVVATLTETVNSLVASVSAISAPDLSTVAKADALAAVATTVNDIDSKVTPTPAV